MASNSHPELNPDKIEFLLIGNKRQRSKYLSKFPIELPGIKTNPAKSARNLGVIFDKTSPSTQTYQQSVVHAFTIFWICGTFAVTFDVDSAKLLATALVSSRLDVNPTRLQCGENHLARLVTKSSPFIRSLPLLCSLHWLPVRFRVLFQMSLLTYKTLREKQHVYVHSMLYASIPSHSLGSNNYNSLSVPRVKTNTGARAFHCCAPSLWNTLSLSDRSAMLVVTLKKHLKTHLLDLAFPL